MIDWWIGSLHLSGSCHEVRWSYISQTVSPVSVAIQAAASLKHDMPPSEPARARHERQLTDEAFWQINRDILWLTYHLRDIAVMQLPLGTKVDGYCSMALQAVMVRMSCENAECRFLQNESEDRWLEEEKLSSAQAI